MLREDQIPGRAATAALFVAILLGMWALGRLDGGEPVQPFYPDVGIAPQRSGDASATRPVQRAPAEREVRRGQATSR